MRVLADDARFDVCRSESAIYSRSKEAGAPRALANVSASVRPGGTFTGTTPDADVILKRLEKAEGLGFGNSERVYWVICLKRNVQKKGFNVQVPLGSTNQFHLEDAVDLPEWPFLFTSSNHWPKSMNWNQFLWKTSVLLWISIQRGTSSYSSCGAREFWARQTETSLLFITLMNGK